MLSRLTVLWICDILRIHTIETETFQKQKKELDLTQVNFYNLQGCEWLICGQKSKYPSLAAIPTDCGAI